MTKPLGPGYMPALDGLRAFAVAAVFAYHLGLPFIPGGFLGVDVFFVISGFLITSLLVSEAERTNRVRIGAFWIRRGRRLFPALVAMIAVVCAAALFIGRDLDVGLRREVIGAAVYGSNWMQVMSGRSYVENFEPSLFTHLWSLAVEEQFYLVWPFVVVLLLSFLSTRRMRVCVVLTAAAASAVWMGFAYVPGGDPTRVYVGTDTHGFALLLGAALGLGIQVVRSPVRTRIPPRHRALGFFGVVGFSMVLAGMLLLSDTGVTTFRGGIVLVDVAAVALVAAAARGAGPVGGAFAAPILTWIGRRSYAIYLWHWPVIVIAERTLPIGTALWVLVVVAISVTMVAAELSWRFVEVPIRTLGFTGWLAHLRDLVRGRGSAPQATVGAGPVSGVTVGLTTRRGLGWLGVAAMLSVVGLAACGVAGAPTRSTLDEQLATAQAALVNHSRTAVEPQPVPRTTPSTTAVPKTTPSTTGPRTTGPRTTGPKTTAPSTTAPTTTASRTGTLETTATRTAPPKTAPPRTAPPKTTPPRTAPPKTTPTPTPAPTRDPVVGPVSAIGDSVMLSAAPDLLVAFPDIAIDAVVSRQWWDLPAVVVGHVKAGDVGATVIVGLGTNGTWSAAQIQAALAPLGNRPVVLVNAFVDRDWQVDVNKQLELVAASRPHTCVADWHSLVKAHKDWIGFDGVHPNQVGRTAYADLLADTVRACE